MCAVRALMTACCAGTLKTDARTKAHRDLAKQLAVDGTVLLKNERSMLPHAVLSAKVIR